MAEPSLRLIVAPRLGQPGGTIATRLRGDVIPCKEWSIHDDIMNVADTAAVSIDNADGRHTDRFHRGQRAIIEESDPTVAGGAWVRKFTGLITRVEAQLTMQGSALTLQMMDHGWFLTSCAARPLVSLRRRFVDVLEDLIDPSWGVGVDARGNNLNRRLKQGRQGAVIDYGGQIGPIYPLIQVEPGETAYPILQRYAAREGLLVNAGVDGRIMFFRPNYTDSAPQRIEVHSVRDARSRRNNAIRVNFTQAIDGLYSEVQCWSTVIAVQFNETDNKNEVYTRNRVLAQPNPLPFNRRAVFSDPDAISASLRLSRAQWKIQLEEWNSWSYEVEVVGHSQAGLYWASDTMVSLDDSIHKLRGAYYVQSAISSLTIGDGARTKLTLRLPGLLDPSLQALPPARKRARVGGGARAVVK